jgi:hypothetical protein
MPHATLSSHVQVIFMPPSHFSIFIVQRGTAMALIGIADGAIPALGIIPVIPMPIAVGFIIVPTMVWFLQVRLGPPDWQTEK